MAEQKNQNNNSVEYRELGEFLVGKFDKVHQEFDKMNAKIDTKADKADMEEKFNLVLARVAMINTKIDDYRAEQIAVQRQLDKHEKWHFAVAKKVGVKLAAE